MQVVSAREFRSNQGKFLTAARQGQSIMLTSRYGKFKIIPITDDDEIVAKNIRTAHQEVDAHLRGDIALPSAKDLIF